MYSKAIFIILCFIKTIRNIQNNQEKSRSRDSRGDGLNSYASEFTTHRRGDIIDDSDNEAVVGPAGTSYDDDGYLQQDRNHSNATDYYNNAQNNVNNIDNLYSRLQYTGENNRYNPYLDPESPHFAYYTRGDADYKYNLREIFKPRGDYEFEDYGHLYMQGDDPNAYNAQNGNSKDGETNVAVVMQPKEENMEGKLGVGNNVNQPFVENDSNENIREHQLNPQVFAQISGDKPQADDEKSEHSIAGSYIPIEKLRLRRKLTFTCSRTTPLINIDFV